MTEKNPQQSVMTVRTVKIYMDVGRTIVCAV